MIETQSSILEKFIKGMMGKKGKKNTAVKEEVKEEEGKACSTEIGLFNSDISNIKKSVLHIYFQFIH